MSHSLQSCINQHLAQDCEVSLNLLQFWTIQVPNSCLFGVESYGNDLATTQGRVESYGNDLATTQGNTDPIYWDLARL